MTYLNVAVTMKNKELIRMHVDPRDQNAEATVCQTLRKRGRNPNDMILWVWVDDKKGHKDS